MTEDENKKLRAKLHRQIRKTVIRDGRFRGWDLDDPEYGKVKDLVSKFDDDDVLHFACIQLIGNIGCANAATGEGGWMAAGAHVLNTAARAVRDERKRGIAVSPGRGLFGD